jgi:hypothetical protein
MIRLLRKVDFGQGAFGARTLSASAFGYSVILNWNATKKERIYSLA